MLFLILLQALQVGILWAHDWVPLGSLNDPAAIRRGQARAHLVIITLVQSVPFSIGLVGSIMHAHGPVPGWLHNWLWLSYLILFAGELRAWWWPYLVQVEPSRAERYATLFGSTHSFLPVRHNIVPNTLHTILHLATAATLAAMAVLHI